MNLVAGIEAEIRRYLAVEGGVGVTLKRCAIWVREGTLGLRLMSVIIEDTQGTPHQIPQPPKHQFGLLGVIYVSGH